jgi:hypothetical protein
VENNERRNGVCENAVPTDCVIECLERLETFSECWSRKNFVLKYGGMLLPAVSTSWRYLWVFNQLDALFSLF